MSWTAVHQAGDYRKRATARPEQAMQKQIIQYVGLAMRYNSRPLTDWLLAIPNGGYRSRVEAAIFKGQGVKAGVNDLVLPVLVAPYGGLWIELKSGKNTLSNHQLDFHQRLREGGQKSVTCWSFESAVAEIADYMQNAMGIFEHRAV